MKISIAEIKIGGASDGPGLRNSVYFAGCPLKCPGCHNSKIWDINSGTLVEVDQIVDQIVDQYADISILGGEPFFQPIGLLELLKGIREKAPHKNIWVFTGYTYEEVATRAPEILKVVDVLVDGRYDQTKREVTKRFAGSTNQRIIHLKNGKIDFIE